MRWASARCKPQCGVALQCTAWRGLAGLGLVRRGTAGHGKARVADGSTEGQPSLLLSMGAVKAGPGRTALRRGWVWYGQARLGAARCGRVMQGP